jgi:hypothetical protein
VIVSYKTSGNARTLIENFLVTARTPTDLGQTMQIQPYRRFRANTTEDNIIESHFLTEQLHAELPATGAVSRQPCLLNETKSKFHVRSS